MKLTVNANDVRWKVRLSSLFMAGALTLSGCGILGLGGETKPPEAKITSPAPGVPLKIDEQIFIEGLVTGDGISKVEIMIDNVLYAKLDADKTKGVSNFPIGGEQPVPWTPKAGGPHALQLIVYGIPDDKLLSKSEPVLVTVQASEVVIPTPPPAPIAQATPVPQATTASAAGAAAPGAPAAAPAAGTAGGPSMTVVNDFVNVRKGPGVGYDKLGQLNKGQTAPVKGKSSDGEWFQITFAGGTNGVGWVKVRDGSDVLVQGNDAAKNVAVASAPPLPAQPVVVQQPAAPAPAVQIIPIGGSPATVAPVAAVTLPPPSPLVGSRNVLRVNVNPASSGSTVVASWNIPNFRDGEFDKGDGNGSKGPIAGAMSVNVESVTSPRTLRLKWRDTAGTQFEDTLVVNVSGFIAATTAVSADCNASNKDWRGGNTNYPFCVAKELGYVTASIDNRAVFNTGQDIVLTLDWNIYGIAGINFIVEGDASSCGPAGTSSINRATGGNSRESFNVKDLAYGGYRVYLQVLRKDGVRVGYNNKIVCVGNGSTGTNPTSTSVPAATSTTSPTEIPVTSQPTSTNIPEVAPTATAQAEAPLP